MAPRINGGMWGKAEERLLIAFYADNEALWNTQNTSYYKRDARNRLLARLQDMLKVDLQFTTTVEDLKRKWANLRTTYMREVRKVDQSKRSGASGREIYTPKWTFFKNLVFLQDIGQPDESDDSLVSQCSLPSGTLHTETLNVVVPDSTCIPQDIKIVAVETVAESSSDSMESAASAPTIARSLSLGVSDGEDTGALQASQFSWAAASSDTAPALAGSHMRMVTHSLEDSRKIDLLDKIHGILDKYDTSVNETFGNFVAAYLNRLDEESQYIAMREINELLFRFRPQSLN